MEPFSVRHYTSEDRPIIKGNGFDGLEIGEAREEAERLVAFLNELLKDAKLYRALKASDRFEVLTDVYNDDPDNFFKSRVSGDGIDYAIQMALDNPRAP